MRPQASHFFVGKNITLFLQGIGSVALLVATFYWMGGTLPVHAAGGQPLISIQPAHIDPNHPISRAYFIFNAKPGTHIQSAVRVINSGAATGNATLYGTDATTGATSGAVYLDRTVRSQDVGSWLTLGESSVTLTPGQSIQVPFEVTIPKNVRSGEHLGGIGMEVKPLGDKPEFIGKGNNVQILTRTLTVIAVEVILPGAHSEALSASGVQAGGQNGYQSLQIALHNTGTMMFKSSGTLQVMDQYGALLQTLLLKLDTFLPATSIDLPVYLKKALGVGNYQIALTLTYGDNHILRYNTHFTITEPQVLQAFPAKTLQSPVVVSNVLPWWMLLVGGFFVLCGLIFMGQQSRRFALSVRARRKNKEGSHV
jgi:hypothetical protein